MILPPSDDHPRSVSILGATGSVGRSTMALIEESPRHYCVVAVTANRNAAALAALARRLGARFAAVADPAAWPALRDALDGSGIGSGAGPAAVREAAALEADWVMAAIVGAAGLLPVLAAIRRGAMVALANKEPMVCAGRLLMAEAEARGAVLLPVDSEHNAIFQAMAGSAPGSIERIVLTASGGPFRDRALATLTEVTPQEAIAHPNWRMGAKISVDSATMMNKGLEVIEAHHLFAVPEERIEVLIHPQSVIHGMVGYCDGSFLAQAGATDMRIPIASALGWPGRIATTTPRLDLAALGRLDFAAPDTVRFPALALARDALRAAGAAPIVLNAANEVAVAAFLARRIRFTDIARTVADVLDRHQPPIPRDLEAIVACDAEARRLAETAVAASPATAARRTRTEAR